MTPSAQSFSSLYLLQSAFSPRFLPSLLPHLPFPTTCSSLLFPSYSCLTLFLLPPLPLPYPPTPPSPSSLTSTFLPSPHLPLRSLTPPHPLGVVCFLFFFFFFGRYESSPRSALQKLCVSAYLFISTSFFRCFPRISHNR